MPKKVQPRITLFYDGGKPFVSGVNLTSGQSYTITAQPNSATKSVMFKRDSTVTTDSTAPFDLSWTPTSVGQHTFVATPYTATGGTGRTGPTVTVTFNVVDAPLPPGPTLTTALVSWTQIVNATGYRVSWGTVSRQYSYAQDVGNNMSYVVPDLRVGTPYYFGAKSYNATTTSDWSNEVRYVPS